jgi:hypothetical protein
MTISFIVSRPLSVKCYYLYSCDLHCIFRIEVSRETSKYLAIILKKSCWFIKFSLSYSNSEFDPSVLVFYSPPGSKGPRDHCAKLRGPVRTSSSEGGTPSTLLGPLPPWEGPKVWAKRAGHNWAAGPQYAASGP